MSRVILKCLEKRKELRYQSAEELLADLANIGEQHARAETQLKVKQVPAAGRSPIKIPGKKLAVRTIAAATVLVILAILGKLVFRRTPAAASADLLKMAIISFENQTGDASYDYLQDAIANLLITSLEESELFRITSWERLRDLLKQSGREDRQVIDSDLGIELCRMDSGQAIIRGSFIKAGDTFVTDDKILDVKTKSLLKTVSSRGEGVESILKKQIDDLSREIGRGFGREESVSKMKATPIAEATTNSLEAYNSFLRGREDFERFYYADPGFPEAQEVRQRLAALKEG